MSDIDLRDANKVLADALESIIKTAHCRHWAGMNEGARSYAMARDARIALERVEGKIPMPPPPVYATFIGGDQHGRAIRVEARTTHYIAPKNLPPSLKPNEPLKPLESEAYALQNWRKREADYYFLVLCGMPEKESRGIILEMLRRFYPLAAHLQK